MSLQVYEGAVFHCLGRGPDEFAYHPDGLLVIDQAGKILACGDKVELDTQYAGVKRHRLSATQLVLPGLIDMHVHLPQLQITARQEDNLLNWLTKHVFSEEARFAEDDYARQVSDRFFSELLKNGTTLACVFLTSHRRATEIAFESAKQQGNRVVMGLNLMDQHAPDALVRPTTDMLADTEALYQQWHGKNGGRIQYAWMPRFALTSTEELLAGIGRLRQQYPDAYLHTHLSEQRDEIQAVKAMFPWCENYTDVYRHFGLLGPKTILAHGIHLDEYEMTWIKQSESALAHCPTSNFFLKSGRFPWAEVMSRNLRVGLGSDVGAGPELSILKALKDAQYMQPDLMIPLNTLFYTATLGAARALHLGDTLGNFEPGKSADFVVVDLAGKPHLPTNLKAENILKVLSGLVYLGDDRLITQTVIQGQVVYSLYQGEESLVLN